MSYPTTTYTTANPTVAADGECDWKVGLDGGQHWIILEVLELICRVGFPIERLGAGTAYTAISAPTTSYTQTP